jgi:hypothetical protein
MAVFRNPRQTSKSVGLKYVCSVTLANGGLVKSEMNVVSTGSSGAASPSDWQPARPSSCPTSKQASPWSPIMLSSAIKRVREED